MRRRLSIAMLYFILLANVSFIGNVPSVHAHPDNPNVPTLVPNDPGYYPEWAAAIGGYNETLGEWNQTAPSLGTNGVESVIALVDTRIMSHPDLDANRLSDEDRSFLSSAESRASKKNTTTRTGHILDNTRRVRIESADFNPHATNIAAIMVGSTNNDMGGSSLVGHLGTVKVVSLEAFDSAGSATSDDEVAALTYVPVLKEERGKNVTAVVAAYAFQGKSTDEEAAITAITSRGIYVFAAAPELNGNDCDIYPVCYSRTNPRVIPVSQWNISTNSLRPGSWGKYAAPVQVKVANNPSNPNLMASFGGFSAATGQPAAIHAAIRSLFPDLTPDEADQRTNFAATAIPDSKIRKLNLYNALTRRPLAVASQDAPFDLAAIDNMQHTPGPFTITARYFGTQEARRISFFVYNVNIEPGSDDDEAPPPLSVEATDSQGRVFHLTVEDVRPLSHLLTQVTFVLSEDMAGLGKMDVSFIFEGKTSDSLAITIQ